jgi:hypothetical protein
MDGRFCLDIMLKCPPEEVVFPAREIQLWEDRTQVITWDENTVFFVLSFLHAML